MKKKFKVEMCRIVYAYKTFEVEAINENDAFIRAKDLAYKTDPKEFETRGFSFSIEDIETE